MTINEIFQLKAKYVVQEMDGDLILVPLTSQVARMNQMFVLNEFHANLPIITNMLQLITFKNCDFFSFFRI